VDWTLEVVVLPVSDLDRSIAFYRDQVGFELDHDTRNEHMHVAQLTPRGSGCSIVIGDLPGQGDMEPGSMRGLQLVVSDATAAREELLSRGVDASEIQVFDERDGGTFFGFSDPDGNTWAVQQLKVRGERPLIPHVLADRAPASVSKPPTPRADASHPEPRCSHLQQGPQLGGGERRVRTREHLDLLGHAPRR
jgi:catechol 2,3-dioxygenase-like lactoylglutathione lyase family enzyme